MNAFKNPFRPGAGHMPPYLAGRTKEKKEFEKLLKQAVILDNLVLTGLRGVGKTVLLETFKPLAQERGWAWVGTDLSEAASTAEATLATRILTDLSVFTSRVVIGIEQAPGIGFRTEKESVETTLSYPNLVQFFNDTPGLVADKLKGTLELGWSALRGQSIKGVIFAYDEAQNLSDHGAKEQYPLALLLDVFQSLQRKEIPFMLVLTGLPTLFPKLVEARTFAERMFRVLFLDRLDQDDSRDAILKPIEAADCPVTFQQESVDIIYETSVGYPFFIQFICREVYDVFIQQDREGKPGSVPVVEIVQKLDTDFFAGRWARATDRQRELLVIIAQLDSCDGEFTVQEVVEKSNEVVVKPFSSSHVNQMLATLSKMGLIYKNRHGKYSFAVPLLGQFIRRQMKQD